MSAAPAHRRGDRRAVSSMPVLLFHALGTAGASCCWSRPARPDAVAGADRHRRQHPHPLGGGLPVALAGTVVLGDHDRHRQRDSAKVTIEQDLPTRPGRSPACTPPRSTPGHDGLAADRAFADVIGWRWSLACSASVGLITGLAWTSVTASVERVAGDQSSNRERRRVNGHVPDSADTGSAPTQAAPPARPSPPQPAPTTPAPRRASAGRAGLTAVGGTAPALAAPAQASASASRRPAGVLLHGRLRLPRPSLFGFTAWLPTLLRRRG